MIEQVLAALATNTKGDTDDPFLVYLTCYQVLQANQDPRACSVLAEAHRLLQQQAAKITDPVRLHAFLNNVATHRALVAAWTATTVGDQSPLLLRQFHPSIKSKNGKSGDWQLPPALTLCAMSLQHTDGFVRKQLCR